MTVPALSATVSPRSDVLQGALADAIFAANLDDVVHGEAPPVYGDPERFFAQTFPSPGLRQMLEAVFGRLSGARTDEAPILRLETSLGGGKTHNLIALYHAARDGLPGERAPAFLEPGLLPGEPPAIGVFVGTSTGATSFPEAGDITPRTVWGHLALQLAGAEGFAQVKPHDEALSAPGSDDLARVLDRSDRNLILIDELSRYLATAAAHPVAGSTLATQTVSFLMSLMEAIAGRDDSCLVLTAAGVTEVFGEETARVAEALEAASDLIGRRARTLRPGEETDLPKILAARLFERVDARAAEVVADAYADAAQQAAAGLPLPERMTSASWRGALRASFPFHPDTVLLLDRRLATISGFQRTRGALRLLARSVRAAWDGHDADRAALLHPHHLTLRERDTVGDLTSRLDRAHFEHVVRADIASPPGAPPANAQAIDQGAPQPLAERLATTVYLHSLTKDTPGVPEAGALGAVLDPDTDPNRLLKALEDLRERAWFLHDTAGGLRFTGEVTLRRIIARHELAVTGTQIERRALQLLENCFKPSAFRVHPTWADAKVVDTSDRATLVLFHWSRFGDDHGVVDPLGDPPEAIQDTWEHAPDGTIRRYRNRLVLLAPAAERWTPMRNAVRRLVALDLLDDDAAALSHLDAARRQEALDRRREAEALARIAVCSLMSVLYTPGGQPPRLEPVYLPVVTQASLRETQTQAIEDHLAAEHKTLATGDPIPDPALVATKLGRQLEGGIATRTVLDAFATRTDLPLVLDPGRVRDAIRAGVANGVWEYHDAAQGDEGWATRDHGADRACRIAGDTSLHPVGSAPEPTAVGDEDIDAGASVAASPASTKRGDGDDEAQAVEHTGPMHHALGRVLTSVSENGAGIASLRVGIDAHGADAGQELTRLVTCLTSPPPPGADLRLTVRVATSLDGDDGGVRIAFSGTVREWQPLRQAVRTLTAGRDAIVEATVSARFAPPLRADDRILADLRAQAQSIGPAMATVRADLGPSA